MSRFLFKVDLSKKKSKFISNLQGCYKMYKQYLDANNTIFLLNTAFDFSYTRVTFHAFYLYSNIHQLFWFERHEVAHFF